MTHRSTVNRNWAIKNLVFLVVLLGLGVWGLYDATVAYPNRGRRHAEWSEWQYLSHALTNGFVSRASVETPQERLSELSGQGRELENTAQGSGSEAARAQFELNQLRWLRSLNLVGLLEPDRTIIDNPVERFEALDAEWSQRGQVNGLNSYDIPVQWLITAVGLGGALWIVFLFGRVKARTYTFDDESMTLTLPGGQTIKPVDIEVFDKRKWHRYLVFLKIRSEQGQLGGQEIRIDLLRHAPVEDWVKRMFREAHPEEYRESFPEEFEAGDGARKDKPKDGESGSEQEAEAGERRDS